MGTHNGEKELVPEKKDAVLSCPQTKLSSFSVGSTSAPWPSGAWNNSQTAKLALESKDNVSNLSQNQANYATSGTTASSADSLSSGVFKSIQPTMGFFNPEKKAWPESNNSGAKSSERLVFPTFSAATNASSSGQWSSVLSGGQTPVFFGRFSLRILSFIKQLNLEKFELEE